jgi:RNA polymerase sigma-70 factor (ECF subfamily)
MLSTAAAAVVAQHDTCYGAAAVAAEAVVETTSAELVQRVVGGGDRSAEAELCRRFAPRVRLYGLKHLRDEDRARDLVQVVLVAMIEAIRGGRVEEPERLDRFVLGICRNLTARARHHAGRAIPTDIAELDLEAVLPREAPLDIHALLHCMQQLEVRARSVLQLSFYRDMPPGEIASVLETSIANVRVIRHRAVVQLRDCMGVAS